VGSAGDSRYTLAGDETITKKQDRIRMTAMRTAAILTALATPALFAPALVRARGRIPSIVKNLCGTLICLIPLGTPWLLVGTPASPLAIWLVAIAGGIVMLKAIDWLVHPRHEDKPVRVWLVLTFWPALQIEDVLIREPSFGLRIQPAMRQIVNGIVGVACGLALTAVGRTLGFPDRHFWLDNVFKVFEIYLLAGGSNNLLVAAFALAGYRVTDGFRYPILARSILDFWSRYNVWIHRWLKRNIFEPIGRRRRMPVLGILAVFGFSGSVHEILFMPITYELLGWQFTFFSLHGLGAIGAAALGRAYHAISGSRVPRLIAILATLAFVLGTAPIFIHCLDRIFDLHRDLGGWVLRMIGL
jgi:MBOAT, membrane-bound O-acyltransferase family